MMRAKEYNEVTFTREQLIKEAFYDMRECMRCLDVGFREAAIFHRHRAIFWESIIHADLNINDDWMGDEYRDMVATATNILYNAPKEEN